MIKVNKLNTLVLKSNYDYSLFNDKTKENFKCIAMTIVILTFFALDFDNMKLSLNKAKDNLFVIIHICIESYLITDNKSKSKIKWKLLIKSNNQRKITIKKAMQTFIKAIFGLNTKYRCIHNQLCQLIDNIAKLTIIEIVSLINNSILFNHDNANKKNVNDTIISKAGLIPTAPFIKTPSLKEYTLVLDMDETLTHNSMLPFGSYFVVRPNFLPFLKEMSEYFELIIFTASVQSYADNIINQLDIDGLISHRLYINHSSTINNKTVKDLSKIGRDINKILLIDNKRDNAKGHYDNYIPIISWEYDLFDTELPRIANKLKQILTYDKDDLRKGNTGSIAMQSIINN